MKEKRRFFDTEVPLINPDCYENQQNPKETNKATESANSKPKITSGRDMNSYSKSVINNSLYILFGSIFFYVHFSLRDVFMVSIGVVACFVLQIYLKYKYYLKRKLKPKVEIGFKERCGLGEDNDISVKKYKRKGFYINRWSNTSEISKENSTKMNILTNPETENIATPEKASESFYKLKSLRQEWQDFYKVSQEAEKADDGRDLIIEKSNEFKRQTTKVFNFIDEENDQSIFDDYKTEDLVSKSERFTKAQNDFICEKTKTTKMEQLLNKLTEMLNKWEDLEFNFSNNLSTQGDDDNFINIFYQKLPEEEIMNAIKKSGSIIYNLEEEKILKEVLCEVNSQLNTFNLPKEDIVNLINFTKEFKKEYEESCPPEELPENEPFSENKFYTQNTWKYTNDESSSQKERLYSMNNTGRNKSEGLGKMSFDIPSDFEPVLGKTNLIKGLKRMNWKYVKMLFSKMGSGQSFHSKAIKKKLQNTLQNDISNLQKQIQAHQQMNENLQSEIKSTELKFNKAKNEFFDLKNKITDDIKNYTRGQKEDYPIWQLLELESKYKLSMVNIMSAKNVFLYQMKNVEQLLGKIHGYLPDNELRIQEHVNTFLKIKENLQSDLYKVYYNRNKDILNFMILTICNKNDFESALNDTAMLMEKSIKNNYGKLGNNQDTTFLDTNIFDADNQTRRESVNKEYDFENFKKDLKEQPMTDSFVNDNFLNEFSLQNFQVEDIQCQTIPYRTSTENYNRDSGPNRLSNELYNRDSDKSRNDRSLRGSTTLDNTNAFFGDQYNESDMQNTDEHAEIYKPNSKGNLYFPQAMKPTNDLKETKQKLKNIEIILREHDNSMTNIENWFKFGKKISTTLKNFTKYLNYYESGLAIQETLWCKIDKESDVYNCITGKCSMNHSLLVNDTMNLGNINSTSHKLINNDTSFMNTTIKANPGQMDVNTLLHNLENNVNSNDLNDKPNKFLKALSNMKHKVGVYRRAIVYLEESLTKFLEEKLSHKKSYDSVRKTFVYSFNNLKKIASEPITNEASKKVYIEQVNNLEVDILDEMRRVKVLIDILNFKFIESRKGFLQQAMKFYFELVGYFRNNEKDEISQDENLRMTVDNKSSVSNMRQSNFYDYAEMIPHIQINDTHDSSDGNLNDRLVEKYREVDQEEFDPYLSKKEYNWINKFLNVMIKEWFINDFFYWFIKKELQDAINNDLPSFLGKFSFKEFKISKDSPIIHHIAMKKSEPFEILADLEISYNGCIHVVLETTVTITLLTEPFVIPISVTLDLTSFFAIMRLCFIPLRQGQSWFSFMGEPVAEIKYTPLIDNVNYIDKFPMVVSYLEKGLGIIFRKLIYPNRKDVVFPLSKGGDFVFAWERKSGNEVIEK